MRYGNTVSLVGGNPNAQIIEFSNAGLGLIGVFDDVSGQQAPEPGTLLLLALGLLAVLAATRSGPRPRRV